MMVAAFAVTACILFRSLKKTEDKGRLVFKWVLTVFFSGVALWVALTSPSGDMASAFIVPIAGAVCGLSMGIIWAPNIGAMFAKPLTNLFDGGDTEIEARPFYSIARSKRLRGEYDKALEAVEEQLLQFPEDYEGWMLKTEIMANDLRRLEDALEAIEQIVGHGHHRPTNIAFALNQVADWQIKYNKDVVAARQALERITYLFPNTQQSHHAIQRISHLATPEFLEVRAASYKVTLKPPMENYGLLGKPLPPPPSEDQTELAHQLVQHLNVYPGDNEARERLSAIYADHYQRIDMAGDQLEQLIATPHQSGKNIAVWLNKLADLHIKLASDMPAARSALTRISTMFPKSSHATLAEMRLARLPQELTAKNKSQEIKLGSYEQNVGLKTGRPVAPS